MPDYGMLVDYEFCTGCHACEVACKQEHRIPAGKTAGVEVIELVRELPGGKLDITNFPLLTRLCFFCAPRVKKGLLPACVQHCMAGCLKFGHLEELAKEVPRGRKVVIYAITGKQMFKRG
jgi:Fe-S-cluster-containing dehydrogenase component